MSQRRKSQITWTPNPGKSRKVSSRHHPTQLLVTTTGYEPLADDKFSVQQHKRFKVGDRVGAEIARSRSVRQQRLYWSVLNKVVEVTSDYRTPEALHEALKMATGHVTIVKLVGKDRIIRIPESTKFDRMPHDAFTAYCTAAFKIIEEELIDTSIDELLARTGVRREVNAAAEIMRQGNWGG